jgi:hypothetical protein
VTEVSTPTVTARMLSRRRPPPVIRFTEGELYESLLALNSFKRERATFFADSTANGKIL